MLADMRRVTVSRALPHHECCSDVSGPDGTGLGQTGLDRIIVICGPVRVTIKQDARRCCQAVFTLSIVSNKKNAH